MVTSNEVTSLCSLLSIALCSQLCISWLCPTNFCNFTSLLLITRIIYRIIQHIYGRGNLEVGIWYMGEKVGVNTEEGRYLSSRNGVLFEGLGTRLNGVESIRIDV
ncbi:hypothetical protein DFH27DRAFT_524457 [Peziza echinospora]|nr:hypothetical protein DFH27DRAFT_524457 [Peziza echinospora]